MFVFRPDKEWSLNAKIIRRLTDTANLRRSDRDTCFVLDFSEKRGNSCKKIHVKEIIWNFEITRLWWCVYLTEREVIVEQRQDWRFFSFQSPIGPKSHRSQLKEFRTSSSFWRMRCSSIHVVAYSRTTSFCSPCFWPSRLIFKAERLRCWNSRLL